MLREPTGIGPAVAEEIEALREQLTVLRQWSCVRPSSVADAST